ncbi:MAG: hypothetical protein PHI31_14445 [Desulfuromonadaceae bacterium]|nr:hypothetical protein [Desulfuromonadaceae bacterium]
MCKLILVTFCAFIVAFTQTGCVGLIINSPEECKNETPFTGVHDIFWKKPHPQKDIIFGLVIPEVPVPKVSNKEEFLKEWGKPDQIIPSSENVETWIYNRHLWCGVIPVLILPVPFILPVCEGFDRIEFQGNEATRLHTRHIVESGGVLFFGPGGVAGGSGGKDPACRFPLPPNNGVDSDSAKPAAQVTP